MATELAKYSWWGRTKLHISEGEKRKSHLQSLILAIHMEIEAIDDRKKKLLEEKKEMECTTKIYNEMMTEWRKKSTEERILREEVENFSTNPAVRDARQIQGRLQGSGGLGGRSNSITGGPLVTSSSISMHQLSFPPVAERHSTLDYDRSDGVIEDRPRFNTVEKRLGTGVNNPWEGNSQRNAEETLMGGWNYE